MLKQIRDFLNRHLDFHIYPPVWLVFIFALALIPFTLYLPIEFGYENGFLEDLQLAVLCCAFILALKARCEEKFFIFTALVITIMMLREVNCGRTIFFPIPDKVNAFYSWKEIPYGYLVHPIYGLYMFYTGIYFIANKCYLTLWRYIKSVPFPVWNIIFLVVGAVLGTIGEDNGCVLLEESGELLFYVSLAVTIDLYGYYREFLIKK